MFMLCATIIWYRLKLSMPPITLLPAAARLLPVVFPEGSIMPDELPGNITEFLRAPSFFAAGAPLLLFISDISPTLGNALEFRFVIPVLRFVPEFS